MRPATIRAQALGGKWETIGADRAAGVWFEGLQSAADGWGSSSVTFTLRRSPGLPWPDLSAFTPIDVEVAGVPVWSGRVADTPTELGRSGRAISVTCEGWQAHLDDDMYLRNYVHTSLTDFVDLRSILAEDLNVNWTAGAVTVDQGVITLSIPKGYNNTGGANRRVGVVVDLGPYRTFTRGILTYTSSNNDSGASLIGQSSDKPQCNGLAPTDWDGSSAFSVLNNAGASGTLRWTTAAPRRYFQVFQQWSFNGTSGVDQWFKITGIWLFYTTAYESGDASILKASDVVKDAVGATTCPLLSTDQSQITATSFNIPSFSPGEAQTPRANWLAVDAYHDWIKQIDVYRRPVYRAKPTAPMFEIGAWSPATIADQSANSGEEIANRVLVAGSTPDGQALTDSRQQPRGADTIPSSTTAAANWVGTPTPTFNGGTVTWTWVPTGGFQTITSTIPNSLEAGGSGPIRAERTYIFTIVFNGSTTVGGSISIGSAVNGDSAFNSFPSGASAQTIVWRPKTDYAVAPLIITSGGGGTISWQGKEALISDVGVTLADRRGFRRSRALALSNPLPADLVAADIIADTWLTDHKTTPFKGTVSNVGAASIRDARSGAYVPPDRLLLHVGELVRFSHLVDPDTGALGREGRLIGVAYDHGSDSATLTIDNTRASFDALMARLASVQGG